MYVPLFVRHNVCMHAFMGEAGADISLGQRCVESAIRSRGSDFLTTWTTTTNGRKTSSSSSGWDTHWLSCRWAPAASATFPPGCWTTFTCWKDFICGATCSRRCRLACSGTTPNSSNCCCGVRRIMCILNHGRELDKWVLHELIHSRLWFNIIPLHWPTLGRVAYAVVRLVTPVGYRLYRRYGRHRQYECQRGMMRVISSAWPPSQFSRINLGAMSIKDRHTVTEQLVEPSKPITSRLNLLLRPSKRIRRTISVCLSLRMTLCCY